jgi:hypothetical protein
VINEEEEAKKEETK